MLQRQTEEVHLVGVAEDCLFNRVRLGHFAQDASIFPDDKDFLWIRVGVHGEVGDHLLIAMTIVSHSKWTFHPHKGIGSDIRKPVPFRILDDIIQGQHSTVVTALEDQDILVLGLLMVKNLVDMARPHARSLNEPPICLFLPREEVPLAYGIDEISLDRGRDWQMKAVKWSGEVWMAPFINPR